jgi:hypothetical protein
MIDNIVIYVIAYYLRFIDFLCNYDLSKLRDLWIIKRMIKMDGVDGVEGGN